MIMLSKSFSLAEACRSEWAERTKTNNIPTDPVIIGRLRYGARWLESLRVILKGMGYDPRLRVNSAFRNKRVNNAVGGVDTSNHLSGRAWDVESYDPRLDNLTLAIIIRASSIPFDELILEHYKPLVPGAGWVHVAFDEDRPRGKVLTISSDGTRHGLPGDAGFVLAVGAPVPAKTAAELQADMQAVIDRMAIEEPDELARIKRGGD